MTESNLQQGFRAGQSAGSNGLPHRARRFATILNLLFARQGLAGKLAEVSRAARHLTLGVKLTDPAKLDAALKLTEPLALAAGCEAVISERRAGLVVYQLELPQGYWEYYTRAEMPAPDVVGLAERRRPVVFYLDPPHSLFAGTSGSGKTEAIKSAMVALLTTYEPGKLSLFIADPHSDFVDFGNVAHLAAPIAHEPAAIANLLRLALAELAHRKADNLRDAPPVIVVVDEAHEALTMPGNMEMVQALAQGRKYRVHLIIGTQKPNHADLPRILDNLDNRFVGKVTEAKVSATITGHAGLQAHKLTGKGDFLHVTGPDVIRFQIAQATAADLAGLERVVEIAPPLTPALRAGASVIPDLVEFPPDPDPKPGGGRPPLKVDPATAAAYFWRNPASISIPMARELFGLSRDGHNLHKEFVTEFITELRRLRIAAGK